MKKIKKNIEENQRSETHKEKEWNEGKRGTDGEELIEIEKAARFWNDERLRRCFA